MNILVKKNTLSSLKNYGEWGYAWIIFILNTCLVAENKMWIIVVYIADVKMKNILSGCLNFKRINGIMLCI